MDCDLRDYLVARQMRAYVTRFVAGLTERNRLPLDYSIASLRLVDLIIDGLRGDGPPGHGPERVRIEPVLRGLGVYLGEVMVRRGGGRWVEFDEAQRQSFGQPVGVRMSDGRVWNPLGRVVNRFEVGSEESIQRFYLLVPGRERRPVATVNATAATAATATV
ncbi:hypothetical protein ACIBLA_06330 [Streptomyces sp. NPDC050433]|uniref:hypothetical protein n=1 Tax=Streptomyces sp. NPDC050433 TaxID=3365615 RepID=UPI00378F7851